MISSSLITKWKRMIKNESVFHVNQAEGRFYSIDKVEGYYNDLTKKVIYTTKLDNNGIPYNIAAHGERKETIYFPITVFQYGLGAYDLYLEKSEKKYLDILLNMAEWAVANQASDGSWDAFGPLHYKCTVSSMAQGEAASLLARAFIETKDEKYKQACIRAVDFMLMPREDGGTAEYTENGIVLLEYPDKATVLNGWIFSAFGLLDSWKITGNKKYESAWIQTISGIKGNLQNFDSGHWSYYDLNGKYTSPFYHKLHIELLKALDKICPDQQFQKYIERWTGDIRSGFWKRIAFANKARQKIFERKSDEWVLAE